MADGDALLAQCVSSPASDAPRLVWADAIGGERGELVTIQCLLARHGRTPAESGVLRRRQRVLVEQHGPAWSGLDGLVKYCRYRRGFVELAGVRAATLIDRADDIFALAPLLASIELQDAAPSQIAQVFALPSFTRIRGLGIPACTESVLVDAAKRGAFANLQTLRFQQLGSAAMHELVRSGQLANVQRLAIPSDVFTDAVLPALLATTPRLRALEVPFLQHPAELVAALPPTITELVISAAALDALRASPLAATIERLVLTSIYDARVLGSLASFPRLRAADLHIDHRVELGAPSCADIALPPSLRELRSDGVTHEGARVLAKAYGAQLELLELCSFDPAVAADLAPLVAGDLFANPIARSCWPPMFAGEIPSAPAWDYPYARF